MKNMNTIAAIDIGSNAVRFLISNIEEDSDKKCRKVAFLRVPVRLGEDAFTSGTISPERRARLLRFQRVLTALASSGAFLPRPPSGGSTRPQEHRAE